MSQVNVERVIGLLATDEGLRREFTVNPRSTLLELVDRGMELTEYEMRSLAGLGPTELARFAQAIDPRLQRACLDGDGA